MSVKSQSAIFTKDFMRTISPELIHAYREAHYIVLDEGTEIHLQVGTVNLELERLMSNMNAHTASVLTA